MVSDPIDPTVIAALDELSDGESFFDEMLAVFLDDLGPSLQGLWSAGERGDVVALFKGAHRLKSAAANLGATRLNEACIAVETPARRGDFAAAVGHLSALRDAAAEVQAWAAQRSLRPTGS